TERPLQNPLARAEFGFVETARILGGHPATQSRTCRRAYPSVGVKPVAEYASGRRVHPELCVGRRSVECHGPSARGKFAPNALQATGRRQHPATLETTS